jgi:carbamate kinase
MGYLSSSAFEEDTMRSTIRPAAGDRHEPSRTIVLAIGGNSLIADPQHQSVPDQYNAAEQTCRYVATLLEQGNRMVLTHGNGPQVGFIFRRSELAAHELHMVPLDSCGADTQGAIGYHLQRALHNVTRSWQHRPQVATVVTQVLVDRNDPAFQNPSKPIGSFMTAVLAEQRRINDHWHVVEDAGRGFRRVVPSPRPREILEIQAIQALLDRHFTVIAAGGGGIPVTYDETGALVGVEAVIDKDLATSLLARLIGADMLVIATAVERISLDFGKATARPIDRMTVAEARRYVEQGHFARGSMLEKVQAMVEFVEATGHEALVTDPPNLGKALAGGTGTRIVP